MENYNGEKTCANFKPIFHVSVHLGGFHGVIWGRVYSSIPYFHLLLHEKGPYSEFFWSVFSLIWTKYGEMLRISPYSVRMREYTDQESSKC